MKVKEMVQLMLMSNVEALKESADKLEAMNCPSTIVNKIRKKVEDIINGKHGINGAKKYAKVMNEEIIDQYKAQIKVYNHGKKEVIIMKTQSGVYSYCDFTETLTEVK